MSGLETAVIVAGTTLISACSTALAVALWFGGAGGGGAALFLAAIAIASVATGALSCVSYLTTNVWGGEP